MIRRPPRSTQGVSSAASDVYKRQGQGSRLVRQHPRQGSSKRWPWPGKVSLVSYGMLAMKHHYLNVRLRAQLACIACVRCVCLCVPRPHIACAVPQANRLRCCVQYHSQARPWSRSTHGWREDGWWESWRERALPGKRCASADDFSVSRYGTCLLYTSPSPRDGLLSRMPSSA